MDHPFVRMSLLANVQHICYKGVLLSICRFLSFYLQYLQGSSIRSMGSLMLVCFVDLWSAGLCCFVCCFAGFRFRPLAVGSTDQAHLLASSLFCYRSCSGNDCYQALAIRFCSVVDCIHFGCMIGRLGCFDILFGCFGICSDCFGIDLSVRTFAVVVGRSPYSLVSFLPPCGSVSRPYDLPTCIPSSMVRFCSFRCNVDLSFCNYGILLSFH